ncbi:MAG: porin [bacterium]|nr:porin [bacterium]
MFKTFLGKTFLLIGVFFVAVPTMALADSGEISALKVQVQALMTRIEKLESQRIAEPTKDSVQVTTEGKKSKNSTVASRDSKFKVSFGGHVNRAALFLDNGRNSKVLHVDNDGSSTRLWASGKAKINEDVALGAKVEFQLESNSTASVDVDTPNSSSSISDRKMEFYVKSSDYGTLWVGKGNMASDGSSERDLSGTGLAGYSGISDTAGGAKFVTPAGVKGPTLGSVYSNMDGLGRKNRVRYDTPIWNGLGLRVGHASGDQGDVALTFDGQIEGTKIGAAFAAAKNHSSRLRQYNGSASVLFPCGLSVTGALGTRNFGSLAFAVGAECCKVVDI